MMRTWLGRLGLTLTASVVTVLVAEWALRTIPGLMPDAWWMEARLRHHTFFLRDPDVGLCFRPGIDFEVIRPGEFSYRIETRSLDGSPLGFRDDGIDQPWAIAVGDSYTEGFGVDNDESWPEVLEQSLGLDVANLGISGFSALQNLAMLRRMRTALNPEVVFFCSHVNDHRDNLRDLRADHDAIARLIEVAQDAAKGPLIDLDPPVGSSWAFSATIGPAQLPEVVRPVTLWDGQSETLPLKPRTLGSDYSIAGRIRPAETPERDVSLFQWSVGADSVELVALMDGGLHARVVGQSWGAVSCEAELKESRWIKFVIAVDRDRSLTLHLEGLPPQSRPLSTAARTSDDTEVQVRRGPWELGPMLVFDRALDEGQRSWYLIRTPKHLQSPYGTVFASRSGRGWSLSIDETRTLVLTDLGTSPLRTARSDRSLSADSLHHVVVSVENGETVRFFIEGEPAGVHRLEGAEIGLEDDEFLLLGAGPGLESFLGSVADVRMHHRLPADSEIEEMSRAPMEASVDGLSAHWRLRTTGPLPSWGRPLRTVDDQTGGGHLAVVTDTVRTATPTAGQPFAFFGTGSIQVPEVRTVPKRSEDDSSSWMLGQLWRAYRGERAAVGSDEKYVPLAELDLELRPGMFGSPMFRNSRKRSGHNEGLSVTKAAIEAAANLCEEQGIRLIVVLSASKEFVYYDFARTDLPELLEHDDIDPGWHWREIVEFCSSKDIEVIALGPPLREIANAGSELLYFKYDAHWTAEGQRQVAAIIERELRRRGLVPSED